MRAIQNCPAVNSLERQVVEMPSPIGIRMVLGDNGEGAELEVIPIGTFVQPELIGEMISLEPPERWRHPKMPVVQMSLPFFLVTDTACMVALLPPFFSASMRRWPRTMVAGRFPLAIWPQNLTWSFEWDRPGEELILKQGEPLCYFLFEFNHPEKRPRVVEAALTPELDEYRRGMDGIHHLTPDIEEIWESCAARRPDRPDCTTQ